VTLDIETLTTRYSSRGVFVDTNLLLLLFVGNLDPRLILTCKRTRSFSEDDYRTLCRYLSHFKRRITTPNVLTEVSNLASALGDNSRFFESVFSPALDVLSEEYVPSRNLSESKTLAKFGLTDAGILKLAKGKFLLLTEDFALAQYFESIGGHAINFNHIRPLGWR
jgi:hypothetical protein